MIDISASHHVQPGAWVVDTMAARVHVLAMAGVAAAHRIYEAFGAQVRERRAAMQLTQLELATRIKLTRGSVANIEAGRQSVLLHQFLDIAAALRVEPAQLLPAREEVPMNREKLDMPESVLDAVRSIKLQGARAPTKR
jgi:DNA-binding XRE family transcriptional regulator